MALIKCVECAGVVSDAAPTCPHCGHPGPGTDARPTGEATKDVDSSGKSGGKSRPVWSVFLWTIGGFVVGVIANGLIEAAGIAVTDWDFSSGYRSSWVWSVFPYAVAVVALFAGLARRHRGKGNLYRNLAWISSVLLLLGVGLILFGAYQVFNGYEGAANDDDPIEAVGTTTSSTVPQPTTSTTSLGDRMIYCLDNYPTDTGCDENPSISIGYLVYDYYWQDQWLPLWEEVSEAADNQDESRARIVCELATPERDSIEARIVSWPQEDPLRELALSWLREMEIQLTACTNGEWETVSESWERNSVYLEEVCSNLAYCRVD